MKTLTMSELHSVMENKKSNELILDVRTPGEFAEGHVPGAANIPVDEVMAHAEELKRYDRVYIYCRAGARAQTAVEILNSMGVHHLHCVAQGGFPNWEMSGLPVEK